MASVSVSHMILFIASMIIAASVAGVFTTSVEDLSSAIEDQGPQVSDQVRTSIDIISDSGSDAVYNDTDGEVTILVKNTGTSDIVPDETDIDVLLNGQFQGSNDVTFELLGEGQTWSSSEVLRITIDQELEDGDHRVKIIVRGNEDVFEFRVSAGGDGE